MRIDKRELVRILGKMKGIVQKNELQPATSGVLVDNGYIVGASQELMVKIRSEYAAGERLVIPMEAFDLISNLPDGDVEITADARSISIKTSAIRNRFSTHDPDRFPLMDFGKTVSTVEADGTRLTDAINNVIFAATDGNANFKGIHMAYKNDKYIIEASDGHMLARDELDISGGGEDMDVIIPKASAKKLVGVGLFGKVKISYGKVGIQFETSECIIGSQLYAGTFPDLDKIINMRPDMVIEVRRRDIQEAVMRANVCITSKAMIPVRLDIKGDEMQVSIADSNSEFVEKIPVSSASSKETVIGFNPKLTISVLKSFDDENVSLGVSGKNMPSIWSSENSRMKAVLLPVNIG